MGLLDALNTDEARLGLSLLAAGGYSATPMSVGQRVQMAMQGLDAQKRGSLQNKLLESQISENASQADMRKQQLLMSQRQMDMQNQLLGIGQPQGAGYIQPPSGMQNLPQTGAPDVPGQLGAATSGATPTPLSGSQAGTLDMLSKQYGIPAEALKYDLVFNGGKGIAEMVSKRGTPNMQVSNGYAYDANRIGPGYLPQLNTSQSGQTSMIRIGPDGLPVVSAPSGAMDTYAGYRRAEEGAKAAFDTTTVTPAGGRPTLTTRGNLVSQIGGAQNPMSAQPGDSDRAAIFADELKKAKVALAMATTPDAKTRAQGDLDGLQREIARLPASVAQQVSSGVPGIPLQSDAEKTGAVDTAKADVVRDTQKQNDIKTAKKFLNITNRVDEVLKAGPTNSGIGSLMDSAGAMVGYATPGSVAAQQLKALGGWLVSNVPRMEGPQSNFDVANYQTMAADVANDSLPLERRKAALTSIKGMMRDIAEGKALSTPPTNPEAATAPVATMRFNPVTRKIEQVK